MSDARNHDACTSDVDSSARSRSSRSLNEFMRFRMMDLVELARGTVTDRPWALTLATLARRGVTGQITLISDQKPYSIAFDRGAVVAARSPMTADSVARVALTSHLVSSSQVNELQRRIKAKPNADEVDLIGDIAKLSPPQLENLRLEVITRRAARTFAPEHGEFVLEDSIGLPTHGCTVDIRAVVYHGIRMHVSDARLSNELRSIGGSYFVLAQDVTAELHKFGFCDGEWPLLAALREGVSIPELEARHRDIDPRTMLAAIYALVACGAVEVTAPPRTVTATAVPRTQTASTPASSSYPRASSPSTSPVVGRTPTSPAVSRTQTPSTPVVSRTQTPRTPVAARPPSSPPVVARTQTPSTPVVSRTQTPSPVVGRTPTPNTPIVGRTPTPNTPPVVGRAPTSPRVAPRQAYARPPSPSYPVTLARGTRDSVPPPEPEKTNPELAAEAAERASRALASDKPEAAVLELKKAVELVPNNVDYNALLGWALFCAADDKMAVAIESRKLLEKAVYKSQQPEVAHFYLGRVERILGRDKEALRHFHAVLDALPNHRDASAEVRVIEARLRRLGNSN